MSSFEFSSFKQLEREMAPNVDRIFYENDSFEPLIKNLYNIELEVLRPELDGSFIPNADRWKEFNPGYSNLV